MTIDNKNIEETKRSDEDIAAEMREIFLRSLSSFSGKLISKLLLIIMLYSIPYLR